ncbi:ParA family protein [Agromyces bauzanensis]
MATRHRGIAIVLAVVNQKGGVGRTTVVLELAQALARRGARVLAVDADPQANLTEALEPAAAPELTLNDVLAGDPDRGGEVAEGSIIDAVVVADPQWAGVEYVPGEIALASREQDQVPGRELRIRRALAGQLGLWDWVLIDCPGSLGQLTISALVAADYAVVVTEARKASVDGVASITATITTIKRHFNPRLELAGIVVNRHDENRADPRLWLQTLRDDYGPLVLKPAVPDRESVPRAYSERTPLAHYGTATADVVDAFDQIAAALVATARKGRK